MLVDWNIGYHAKSSMENQKFGSLDVGLQPLLLVLGVPLQ